MDRRDFFAVFAGFATALGLDKIVPADDQSGRMIQADLVTDADGNVQEISVPEHPNCRCYAKRVGRPLDGRLPAARYLRIHGISQTKGIPRGEYEFETAFPNWRADDPKVLFTYQRRGLKIDGTCNPMFMRRVRSTLDTYGPTEAERYILTFATRDQLDAGNIAYEV